MAEFAGWGAGMHGSTFAIRHWLFALCIGACVSSHDLRAQPASIQVSPSTIALDNPESTQQMLVRSKSSVDLTRTATYDIFEPKIVTVDATGLVQANTEGQTVIAVRFGNEQARIPVAVSGLKAPAPVSFETQVMPILTLAGCNAGACHGQ